MDNKLERWLAGEMTAAEERDFRQLAESDPFVKDALDGYFMESSADHLADLAKLEERLPVIKTKSRSIGLWRKLAVAASLLLIGSLAFFLVERQENPALAQKNTAIEDLPPTQQNVPQAEQKIQAEEDQTAVHDEPQQSFSSSDNVSEPSSDAASRRDLSFSTPTAVQPDAAQAKKQVREEVLPKSAASTFDTAEMKIADDQSEHLAGMLVDSLVVEEIVLESEVALTDINSAEEIQQDNMEAKDFIGEEQSATRKKRDLMKSKLNAGKAADARLESVSGVVADVDGEPIIGASVLITGTTIGIVTDLDGRFELQAARTFPWKLNIYFIGMEGLEIQVDSADQIVEVFLENDGQALQEVVVSGVSYGESLPKNYDTWETNPKPKGGSDKFEAYVNKQLSYPQEAYSLGIEGTVLMRFDISADGRPVNIHFIKSLGYGCDLEARRLLVGGPKWKPAGGEATVVIEFKWETRN